ncbi:MAG: SpoIIE family protein phosphatase [Spirochaetales bacterium]|nr:SpoIIE family protein phosphatase [Spirochaetales bacterium]
MAKANIMVVEDEGLVAMELKEELKSMGYHVSYTADSGEDALKNLLTAKPDLVLMDIQLKGAIDGIQTAQQIFSEYHIPIVYLTAYSDEKTLSRARESEPYGFLIKPFSERTLYTTIEMALSKAEKERNVRHNWEWYSHVVKCMGEAVIVTDEHGTIRLLNPEAERLTGWTYAEASCKDFNEVFPLYDIVDQEHPFTLPFAKVLSEGELVFYNRFELTMKQGERLPVNITLSPLVNEQQKIIGIIITIGDRSVEEKSQAVIKRELDTAVNIQKSLLPEKLETIYGIRSHWFFYPSPFGSGDIFNFRSLDNTHVGFYILDVMGHGFSAALFSLVLHRILTPNIEVGGILKKKAAARKGKGKEQNIKGRTRILSPKEVITELNKRFYFNAAENPFFSIVYGVINVRTGKTKLARAGHTYPILLKKDGKLIQIDEGGPAIGIFPEMKLDEYIFTFEPGERLIMYSDGLVDVRNHKQEHFTLQRLLDFLKSHKKTPLETLIANLKTEITEYMHHTESTDDITFFLLERP